MDYQSYCMIDKSKEYLGSLGAITHRAMFGGYSLAIGDVVFAMVAEQHLYLRACGDNADYFSYHASPKLNMYKRGRQVTLDYLQVGDELWQQRDKLREMAYYALRCARQGKARRTAALRLKDLPNLTTKLEVQLCQAGICDINTLRAYGARTCWLRIKANNNALGIRSLYALEGAIAGIHADALPNKTRNELLNWINGLSKGKVH